MTRRFLDDIHTDVTTLLADNSIGAISPADMRSITGDMLDSLKQDEATIYSTAATANVILTGTFAPIISGDTDVYDAGEGDDGNFLKVSLAGGSITGTATQGFTYVLSGTLNIDGANNEVVELSLGEGGSPDTTIVTVVGTGTEDQSRYWERYIKSAQANAVFTILARAQDGAANITVNAIRLTVAVLPTNNP